MSSGHLQTIYEGGFQNGKLHGFVKSVSSDGKSFEGHYINDKKNGHGKFVWDDYFTFEGNYENDKI